jgi:hypothetical protein
MRSFGALLLLLGVFGFLYATDRVAQSPEVNPGATVTETLREEKGRWEAIRYVAAAAGGIGLLMALYPKGR